MTTFTRKTEFWSLNTPHKVGPGSYNLAKVADIKPSSAPFKSGVIKEEPLKKAEIGPGSYLGLEIWDSDLKGASMLASNSPRMGPFATGILGFTMPTNVYNPGPGTYITELNKKPSKSLSARRHSLTIDPTASSIPAQERQSPSIGPTTYHPDYKKVKPSSKSTHFAGSLSKRNVFEGVEAGPGPGEYSPELSKGKSFFFPRSTKSNKPGENPGPGTYEQPKDRAIRKVQVESFGVLEKKSIIFSKDPHRPVQVGYSENPPVGLYDTGNQLKTAEKLKQKFISYETPIPKPGFNVSTKREMKWVDNPTFPGPGAYTEVKQSQGSEEKVPFGGKQQKFHNLGVLEIPGPGSYEKENPKANPKTTSVFASKTPRFSKVASDNLSVSVVGTQPNLELDQSHSNWRAKQSRAFDTAVLKPTLSFESTACRFFSAKKDQNLPGPGQYESRPDSVPTKAKRTAQRFGAFENYRPKTGTSQNVGPGSYSVEDQKKKSFNMSGELAKVRPWIA